MTRDLKTVSQFSNSTVWTESQLRWMIHCARENGLTEAGALVRCGRRIYIDTAGFDAWLRAQNPGLREVRA